MDILMVGCGRMGGAMLNGWAGLEDTSFTVVDPAVTELPVGVRLEQNREALGSDQFDMILVAVKPQMIDDIMPSYVGHLKAGGCIASIAAGYSLKGLEAIFQDAGIIRVMPNLPALIGKAATGLFANDKTSEDQKHLAGDLMDAIGSAVWVQSEDELDRLTAVSGSGPGYVFQFIESFVAAAEELGFSHGDARTLVLQTMAGAVDMARTSDMPVSALRQSVTSKGGTTQAGLEQLRQNNVLDHLMVNTTQAAYARAVELK